MTSGSGLLDFQPPMVIDIGSDKVKFSQAVLNTYSISKKIRSDHKKDEELKKEKQKEIEEGEEYLRKKQKEDEKINKVFGKMKNNILKSKHDKLESNDNLKIVEDPKTPLKNTTTNNTILTPEDFLENFNLNSNSVFDYNLFMDSFPTILGLINNDSEDSDYFNKLRRFFNSDDFHQILKLPEISGYANNKIKFSFDFLGSKVDHKSNTFGYEPIWSGKINTDHIENWKNLMERVGELKFKKFKFLNQLYTETPLILTQHTLPFQNLKEQVKKIYEIVFEEYKCPYVLITSQAMLNLFSHNLNSGIVVDMGESGTSISTVKNGFTQYSNSIISPFLSGRNITSILALYLKNKKYQKLNDAMKNKIGFESLINLKELESQSNLNKMEQSFFDITLADYFEAKFLKESNPPFMCYTHQLFGGELGSIEKYDMNYKNYAINTKEISTFNYLYSFPELYKWVFSSKKYINSNLSLSVPQTFFSNLQATISFITNSKADKFNERMTFNNFSTRDFEKSNIHPYLTQDFDSIEKRLLTFDLNFVKKEELTKFRFGSLTHLIFQEMEKLISADTLNSNKYTNVIFTGGVLNTFNFSSVLEQDFYSLLFETGKEDIKFNFMKNINGNRHDHSMDFYKGANYLSKINDLDQIMISRKEFYDFGADYLCYNYI